MATDSNDPEKKGICGIVMPISSIDGCDESHWQDVLSIFQEAILRTPFEPNLVSYADDVGIIQKRIVQNLYENPIVVCDISGKNPNVMFELGLRLAFDKPTIIVKDDKTPYPFDTSPIEHINYPRDLRFNKIVEFKDSLTQKIMATSRVSENDPNYTTFLKHFGTFTVAKLDSKEVTGNEFLIEEFKNLKDQIISINLSNRDSRSIRSNRVNIDDLDTEKFFEFMRKAKHEIRSSIREMGLKGPEAIRSRKNEIRSDVEVKVSAPRHFSSEAEFNKAFDVIFTMMYDS